MQLWNSMSNISLVLALDENCLLYVMITKYLNTSKNAHCSKSAEGLPRQKWVGDLDAAHKWDGERDDS